MVAPIIDPTWYRLPSDTFSSTPSSSTPFHLSPTSPSSPDTSSDYDSDWSYDDEEELLTLDLGTDLIARRALLGYTVGLDSTDPSTSTSTSGAATSSMRTVRGNRSSGLNPSTPPPGTTTGGKNAPHLGAGKLLSITGLNTPTPLMKINDTVLRGRPMEMLGTEIVLGVEYDGEKRKHRLQPIPPTAREGRADANSSSTRKRILFRPIYDPASRETGDGKSASYDALRALVKPSPYHVNIGVEKGKERERDQVATLASLMGTSSEAISVGGREGEGVEEKGVGRGKYKRKPIGESEQIIRKAERKIRKAAKLHFRQRMEGQHERGRSTAGADDQGDKQRDEHEQEEEREGEERLDEPRPPPSFEQP